jgi:CBS domain-containing protein
MEEIKIHEAISCRADTNIVDAARIIKDKNIRHIYVVDESDIPVGIISAMDINNKVVAEGKDPNQLKASQVMNSPVDSVDINAPVELAMNIMMKRKTYSCLVTQDGKVKGVVDYKTVMEKIVKDLEDEDA